jgi:hypothetical protein
MASFMAQLWTAPCTYRITTMTIRIVIPSVSLRRIPNSPLTTATILLSTDHSWKFQFRKLRIEDPQSLGRMFIWSHLVWMLTKIWIILEKQKCSRRKLSWDATLRKSYQTYLKHQWLLTTPLKCPQRSDLKPRLG